MSVYTTPVTSAFSFEYPRLLATRRQHWVPMAILDRQPGSLRCSLLPKVGGLSVP